jgi:hypothetical protein
MYKRLSFNIKFYFSNRNFIICFFFFYKMNFFAFFTFSILISIGLSITRERRDDTIYSSLDNYIFSLPDIIATFKNEQNTKIRLTAFKTRYNDAIIKSKSHNDFGQLRWVSLGHPTLVPFYDTHQYFELNNQQLFSQVSMLTDEHIEVLKNAIHNQYRELKSNGSSQIANNQIVDMPLTEFKCKLKLDFSNIVLNGEVKNFAKFPLTLTFKMDTFKEFKTCINTKLFDQSLKHTLECQVAQKVKLGKANILTIDAGQQIKHELVNEIFGPSNFKYVTRNQLDQLSSRLMRNLNVYEEFEFDEEKDMTHIRDEILKQTSIETFKNVPIKEALESLSSFNINKDLSPDVITSDLSKLLKIVKHGEIEHIKVEHGEINKLMRQIRENSGGGGGLSLG